MKIQEIAENRNRADQSVLSEFACHNVDAFRNLPENDSTYRPPFALDRDRILYSGAFRRYTGKTQVIYFASMLDEELTSRSMHTLSVSQIARTIGRYLSLNLDLIEAIALGHDLGHTPFGHDGEIFLDQLSREHGTGRFFHNIQSLRIVDSIAKKGRGLNLSFQTRDGILSHNGEVHNQGLRPDKTKTENSLLTYVDLISSGKIVDMMPATLEGCVVRITDTIAYIGQDIDDAIRIGIISRDELPEKAVAVLGRTTGEIIDTLVNDVAETSCLKNYVSFSKEKSDALLELKQFNYKHIYRSEKLKTNHQKIENGFRFLYGLFADDLKSSRQESEIFTHFLNSKSETYRDNTPNLIKVRDFMAGMTDRYFNYILQKKLIPQINNFI